MLFLWVFMMLFPFPCSDIFFHRLHVDFSSFFTHVSISKSSQTFVSEQIMHIFLLVLFPLHLYVCLFLFQFPKSPWHWPTVAVCSAAFFYPIVWPFVTQKWWSTWRTTKFLVCVFALRFILSQPLPTVLYLEHCISQHAAPSFLPRCFLGALLFVDVE